MTDVRNDGMLYLFYRYKPCTWAQALHFLQDSTFLHKSMLSEGSSNDLEIFRLVLN